MVCSGRPGNLAGCPTGGPATPVLLGWTLKSAGIVREAEAVEVRMRKGVTLSKIGNGFNNQTSPFLLSNFDGM